MIDAAHTSATRQQCWECAQTATLIAVVPGEDGNAAHHVFKCEHCGYFNWIDESQPGPHALSRPPCGVRSRLATSGQQWTPSGRSHWRIATKQRRKPLRTKRGPPHLHAETTTVAADS